MMIRKLADDDVQLFERLALPWLPLLLRTAKHMTHNEQDGDDLVQESLIKAMRSLGSLRDEADIRSWLLTILRRTFIDGYRAGKRRATVSLEGIDAVEPTANEVGDAGIHDGDWHEPEALMSRIEDESIIEGLRSLPPDIRWTLLLVDVEQLDQAEAAKILEVPLGTIKSRAHRGRQMLRDHLFTLAQVRGWLPAATKGSKS